MSEMNIYQKLAKVRDSVAYIKKGKQGQSYSYVSSSDVISSIRKAFGEHGVLLKPEITGHTVSKREMETSKGKATAEYFTEIEMLMTWINIDNPDEVLTCEWYSQGVDLAGEKGIGKALTYAEKNFILKFFNIPTDDLDPDTYQQKMMESMPVSKQDIDAIEMVLGTLEELTGEPAEAFREKACIAININVSKSLDTYTKKNYGELMNTLVKWKNAYEDKKKKADKK